MKFRPFRKENRVYVSPTQVILYDYGKCQEFPDTYLLTQIRDNLVWSDIRGKYFNVLLVEAI